MHSALITGTGSWAGIVAILMACLLWGTTGTAASFAEQVSPLATGAFAMGMGGLLLVLASCKYLRKDAAQLKQQIRWIMAGGLAIAVYPLCFYSSMHYAGIAVGSVVSLASAPFWSALLELFVDKRKVSNRWLISFLIGCTGIALLAFAENHSGEQDSLLPLYNLGIVAGLMAGLTYALYSWTTRSLLEKGVHAKAAMPSQFAVAVIILLPSLLITGDNLFATTTNSAVALYMAVVPMFLGYLAFAYGLRFIPASQATLLTLSEPLFATLLAVIVVGERINAIGWVGMALILLCLLIQTLGKKPA
ncbi:DMT family transporter [Parendozoicomonas haliclonae]|uniref:Putative DMT superfamily transporter inner membrane protein n=1 Tax=Parendozoicomonas haliclonae TaxID=1960125 RepID=A0A1X7AL80_9GAMM|nr:EamA family transporter [Parendozoicomonas haliclonae]SMA45496.1 putative DMT superfamily transporter inner membrane protein [Parendozoicomonas haliclonae]